MNGPKKKSRRKFLLFAILALAAAGSGLGFYLKKREVWIDVQTDKVARRSLTELVIANGRIQPVLQVKISPEVSGEIIELPVKEGQAVKKGDLLLRIKPDFYAASRRSAEASFRASEAAVSLAEANLKKAEAEFKRNQELLDSKLISESAFLEFKTAFEVGQSSVRSAVHQVEVARAALARADEEMAKTIISSPLDGTVSKLISQLGERVVGTALMTGTEVMTVADLNEMEARVDIGEVDIVLIAAGQKARLEVDAFRDRKFNGTVTEIANSSKGLGDSPSRGGGMGGGQQQEATRFEVKIRVAEKEMFRPGMSVTGTIETRSRTNVLSVPFQSVTTRPPKTNNVDAACGSNSPPAKAAAPKRDSSDPSDPKARENAKPVEVVFALEGDRVKALPIKRGISDENFTEIIEGLTEGQEVISGGYKAISRDLEDGKRVRKNGAAPATPGK
jgi:HlyD family secretion protein